MKHIFYALLLFSFLIPFHANAQDLEQKSPDTTWYALVTHDGVEYIGQILDKNDREYHIRKQDGTGLYIPAYLIKTVEPIHTAQFKEGTYMASNPHASRYFYTPSAIPIKKGDGYIQTIFGAVWQFQYGITDHFSLGIGTPLIGAPIWITPKFSFKLADKIHFALGAQAGSIGWLNQSWKSVFGVEYGVFTFGDDQANLSLGAGYLGLRLIVENYYWDAVTQQGYYLDEVEKYGSLAVSLAGMKRINNNMSLMMELWTIPSIEEDMALFFGGPGLRLRRNLNIWDFGFWVIHINNQENQSDNLTFPVPYISFTWKL